MSRTVYPSDLSDVQWQRIEGLIPKAKKGGRPRSVNMREVMNGILYLLRSSCAWRMLPHDLPPWGTVHYYYRKFRLECVWQRIQDGLREEVRQAAGREATPSASVINSQSVKTTEKGGSMVMTPARRSMAASAI